MKKIYRHIAAGAVLLSGSMGAHAQYAAIANQLPNLISPALSGSMRYRGFVEAEYLKGVGSYNLDFAGISTTQGFQYSDWFFMGVGLGVQYVHSNPRDDWNPAPDGSWHDTSRNGCMIPIFTDFRFNIGNKSTASFFADVRVGASFLAGNNYLSVNRGYLTNNEYFYLRPSIGVRIPVNANNNKQAIDIGVSYQLLTADYWYTCQSSEVINAVGVNIGFEW